MDFIDHSIIAYTSTHLSLLISLLLYWRIYLLISALPVRGRYSESYFLASHCPLHLPVTPTVYMSSLITLINILVGILFLPGCSNSVSLPSTQQLHLKQSLYSASPFQEVFEIFSLSRVSPKLELRPIHIFKPPEFQPPHFVSYMPIIVWSVSNVRVLMSLLFCGQHPISAHLYTILTSSPAHLLPAV